MTTRTALLLTLVEANLPANRRQAIPVIRPSTAREAYSATDLAWFRSPLANVA